MAFILYLICKQYFCVARVVLLLEIGRTKSNRSWIKSLFGRIYGWLCYQIIFNLRLYYFVCRIIDASLAQYTNCYQIRIRCRKDRSDDNCPY